MSNRTNIRILLYLISVLSLPLSLISQGTINPFDLKKSSNTSLFEAPIDSLKEQMAAETSSNPFNIIRSSAPDDKKKAATAYVPPFKKRQIELAKKSDGRFLFWTVTAILFLLTPIVSLYNNVIKKAYRGFLNASF